MAEETVTVGDCEVEIRETDDGFEAVAVEEEPGSGLYLRGTAEEGSGTYGFDIPVDADFIIEENNGLCKYKVAFNEADNVDDDLRTTGGAGSLAEEHDFDGHVNVKDIELVER